MLLPTMQHPGTFFVPTVGEIWEICLIILIIVQTGYTCDQSHIEVQIIILIIYNF